MMGSTARLQSKRTGRTTFRSRMHTSTLVVILCITSCVFGTFFASEAHYNLAGVVLRDYMLHNGGRVVLLNREQSASNTEISIAVLLRAGHREAPRGMKGLAHLVEHLVAFDVSRKRIPGPRPFISADFAATTSYDAVIYTATFNYFSEIDTCNNIKLLRDSVFNTHIPPGKVECEKHIVDAEYILMQTSGEFQATGNVIQFLDATTDIGQIACGSRESLASVKEEDVKKFIGTHYSIENAIVFVRAPSFLAGSVLAKAMVAFALLKPRKTGKEGETGEPSPKRRKVEPGPSAPPTSLASLSPINSELKEKVLVLRSVSLAGSAYKKLLSINIFAPPVHFIHEEFVLTHFQKMTGGDDLVTTPILNALLGYVCQSNFSRTIGYMSHLSEKRAAAIEIKLFLTTRGERHIGRVIAIVEQYMKKVRSFVEENMEQFKENVFLSTSKGVADLANEILSSYTKLDMFAGITMRENGLRDVEQLLNAVEAWKAAGCNGMPEHPGKERLDEYIKEVLRRLDSREFWAVSRISTEGPFVRRVPYILNEEARIEKWPEVSAGEKAEIVKLVDLSFTWVFKKRDSGIWGLEYRPLVKVRPPGYMERLSARLEDPSEFVSLESVEREIGQLPVSYRETLEVERGVHKITVRTFFGSLSRMQFAWDSPPTSWPPVQSCSLFLYTTALQPDSAAAAAAILHFMLAVGRFTDRCSSIIGKKIGMNFAVDSDGNISFKITSPNLLYRTHAKAAVEEFLHIYQSADPYTEKEIDQAKNLITPAILEKSEGKWKYEFSSQRLITALTTDLKLGDVLGAMDSLSPEKIAAAHIRALEVSFDQFASFGESHLVYQRILDVFEIRGTEDFLRSEHEVDSIWSKVWSLSSGESIEIHKKTSELKKKHVFFGIPIPLDTSESCLLALADCCLQTNYHFDVGFMRSKVSIYYCYFYLFKLPVPPVSLHRYLLCFEASGTASVQHIIAAIRKFCPISSAYYTHSMSSAGSLAPAPWGNMQETLRQFSQLLTEVRALIITESPSAQ